MTSELTAYHWQPQPAAAQWVARCASQLLDELPDAAAWAKRLAEESGNRFTDLIDTLCPATRADLDAAIETGWAKTDSMHGYDVYRNPTGVFPDLAVPDTGPDGTLAIDLKVDRIEDFFLANGLHAFVEGCATTRYRRATVAQSPAARLGIVQRLGFDGIVAGPPIDLNAAEQVLQSFRNRPRGGLDETGRFEQTLAIIDDGVAAIGTDAACQLFFLAEREYWQTRNAAARVQHQRQQKVGIGWANHDHHTYRSSRAGYKPLIACLEALGLFCRERFYPGHAAGWGAQVLEQSVTRIVVFADVDMSAEELQTDFPHIGLPPRPENNLGTVGLWCALHGESMLQAGMHHLECMFDFDGLARQLKAQADIDMMPPFSDFPHLRQQFTQGQWWPVDPLRIDQLLSNNQITKQQADQFRDRGAIGSHLENLERNDGFKGFNQTGIDAIIAQTDPRKQAATHL